jgi:hypothetical protein
MMEDSSYDAPRLRFMRVVGITKTRKEHVCWYCSEAIPKGSSCVYMTFMTEDDDRPTGCHAHDMSGHCLNRV